jgi:hypothetical protein
MGSVRCVTSSTSLVTGGAGAQPTSRGTGAACPSHHPGTADPRSGGANERRAGPPAPLGGVGPTWRVITRTADAVVLDHVGDRTRSEQEPPSGPESATARRG